MIRPLTDRAAVSLSDATPQLRACTTLCVVQDAAFVVVPAATLRLEALQRAIEDLPATPAAERIKQAWRDRLAHNTATSEANRLAMELLWKAAQEEAEHPV